MLHEFLTSISSRCCPYGRQAGLAAEVAGIAGRRKRHKDAWAHHLTNTQDFIKAQLALADPEKPILLLGAGLCLDVPLAALNAHPAGTTLIDAVYPLASRMKCRPFKNIRFQCFDATGFLEKFWGNATGKPVRPPAIAPIPAGDWGMIISCNMLSQLPLSFAGSPPDGDIEIKLTAVLQLAHMKMLRQAKCPIVLISDYERQETTDIGSNMGSGADTVTIVSAAPHLLPGEPAKEWIWPIAPKGEIGPNTEVSLKVGAWLFSGS